MSDTSTKNSHETRYEHVRFESAQVTGTKRVCSVGKTKEIRRFRALVEPSPPGNFLWVYSYGGTQDSELTVSDRVADVFPDEASIDAAGWSSQDASDLLAVLGPKLVGVPANRIPHFLRRLQGRRFSEWQAEVDAERHIRHIARVQAITSARSARRRMPPESGSKAA